MSANSNSAFLDTLVRLSLIAFATMELQGCVSSIIASGRYEPDLSDGIGLGQHRPEIIEKIGYPIRSIKTAKGTLDLYVKKIDKEAYNRSRMLAVGSAGTYFLAEPFLLAEELLTDHRVTVHYGFRYDGDDVLESITHGGSSEAIEKSFIREMNLRTEAIQGDKESAFTLAMDFRDDTYLKPLAEKGDRGAALLLARRFQESSYLEPFAEKGDFEAAIELARLSGNVAPLRKLAEAGDRKAAYALYKQLSQDDRTTMNGWRVLCSAANARHPQAQAQVGLWHQQNTWTNLSEQSRSRLIEAGVRPHNQVAFMWFIMAKRNGANAAELPTESWGASVLTPEQIAHAKQMALDWKPGDCPSAQHRLPPL